MKKDFGKYFNAPDLKEARNRNDEEVNIIRDFEIPENIKTYGLDKKYLIRTFGCQMNTHDSEVMAGILEDMGYIEAQSESEADIILLNTCAIRENAEDRVFGVIGSLKKLREENPNMILGVCGCMS